MNKKVLAITLSISLVNFSTHAMQNSSGFLDGLKKFFLPYPVMGHTYKTAECAHDGKRHVHTHRYKLATRAVPGAFVVPDEIGNNFVTSGSNLVRDKNGEFFVEKSAEQKINDEQDLYDQGTHKHTPHASFKGMHALYRDYLGRYLLTFTLRHPYLATSCKYSAMGGGLYGLYYWWVKSKTKDANIESEEVVVTEA